MQVPAVGDTGLAGGAGRLKKPTKAAVKKAARNGRWEVQQPKSVPTHPATSAQIPAAPCHNVQCHTYTLGGAGQPPKGLSGLSQAGRQPAHDGRLPHAAAAAAPAIAAATASPSYAKAMQRQQEVDRLHRQV